MKISFGAPLWFWAFALLPVLDALFLWNQRKRAELMRKLIAARLESQLAGSLSKGKRRLQFELVRMGMVFVILALTQPRWGYTFEQSKRKGRDVIIALDTSKSMLANDLQPNRLTRAKLAAQDLINALPGDRVGLIAFAGNAFLQAPLTIDYSAVIGALNELDTNIIPRGGTDIAAAIKVASDAFGKGESTNRALIIFTDGEELEENAVEAARAQAENFRIFTVGVGSKDGSLIPVPDERGGTTFVKDERGQYVKSRLDDSRLTEIASASGGFYVQLQNGPATMKQIIEQGLGKMQEHEIDARQARRPIERYQWPLAAALVFLASSMLVRERRRVSASRRAARRISGNGSRVAERPQRTPAVTVIILFVVGLFSASAWASDAGVELYEKQDYKGALEAFQKELQRKPDSETLNFNTGAAAYKSGRYDQAMNAFSKAITARDPQIREKAEYNLANTLFQRGAKQTAKNQKLKEWQNALEHYEQALRTDPKDEDAKYNRDLVKKMIEDLEKEPPKQQQQNKQNQQQQNQQQKDDQQEQNSNQNQQNQQNSQDQNQQQQQQQNDSGSSKEDQKNQQQQSGKGSDQQQQQGKEQQQQQDQQNKGDQSDEQKKQNQQAGNSDQQKQQNQQQQSGQGSDSNDAKQQQPQNQSGQAQTKPQPSPSNEKLSGDIQAQQQPGDGEQQNNENAEANAAAAQPIRPGEMNEAQARALVDSLKGEDEHVSLSEHKGRGPVLKDW